MSWHNSPFALKLKSVLPFLPFLFPPPISRLSLPHQNPDWLGARPGCLHTHCCCLAYPPVLPGEETWRRGLGQTLTQDSSGTRSLNWVSRHLYQTRQHRPRQLHGAQSWSMGVSHLYPNISHLLPFSGAQGSLQRRLQTVLLVTYRKWQPSASEGHDTLRLLPYTPSCFLRRNLSRDLSPLVSHTTISQCHAEGDAYTPHSPHQAQG